MDSAQEEQTIDAGRIVQCLTWAGVAATIRQGSTSAAAASASPARPRVQLDEGTRSPSGRQQARPRRNMPSWMCPRGLQPDDGRDHSLLVMQPMMPTGQTLKPPNPKPALRPQGAPRVGPLHGPSCLWSYAACTNKHWVGPVDCIPAAPGWAGAVQAAVAVTVTYLLNIEYHLCDLCGHAGMRPSQPTSHR